MQDWIYGDYVEAAAAHKAGATEIEATCSFIDAWVKVSSFTPGFQYRWRKPVVYHEVQLKYTPMTEKPKYQEVYFVPWVGSTRGFEQFTWYGDAPDIRLFACGMCFATEEAVKEYIKQHGWVK